MKLSNSISEIVSVLCELNVDNPIASTDYVEALCEKNVNVVAKKQEININEITSLVKKLQSYNLENESWQWRYISLNIFYLIYLGKAIIEEKNGLSVQQTNEINNVLRNVVGIGISSNILPNLPFYTKLPSYRQSTDLPLFDRYKLLLGTTYGILLCCKFEDLKIVIVSRYLRYILCGLYQILHCPLKQPSTNIEKDGFVMSPEIYKLLIDTRKEFELHFTEFSTSVHTLIYIRETMMLFDKRSPLWLKKAVSFNLTEIIQNSKGVEKVTWAMLDAAGLDDLNDNTKSWKTLDIIARIIMDTRKLPNFRENICEQIKELLELRTSSHEFIKPFEILFTLCTKLLFQQDELLCSEVFVKHVLEIFYRFTDGNHSFNEEDITDKITQSTRLLYYLFLEDTFNVIRLPISVLTTLENIFFYLYTVTFNNNNFTDLSEQCKLILIKIIQGETSDQLVYLFDNFLFQMANDRCLRFRLDLEIVISNEHLLVNCSQHNIILGVSFRADVLLRLMKHDLSLLTSFFSYLLNCLINPGKYFKLQQNRRDLLELEEDATLDEVTERKLAVYKLLSELAENKDITKHINENPTIIISFFKQVFQSAIDNKVHNSIDLETEEYQTLFTSVMILNLLIKNNCQDLRAYKSLTGLLKTISENGSNNTELQTLTRETLYKLLGNIKVEKDDETECPEKIELEKALEDVCDPLLPVRGHGLLTLTKLIQRKNHYALERKQYILNLFQQNLKNVDSFLYLNSIEGLSAMADVFPDTVINVFAQEYTDFSRRDIEDTTELKLKLGEVFVRVIKCLGEMTVKYKSVLLNTFLVGTRDDDHLIRASSLSNLGEVCKVLGYKLGTIITEILVCIHAIITTDKAVEPRRAAVTVIRQLFVGLEKETIVVLKEEILPVYRTLKHIYYHDSDEVMRLQAQLALEQLNENMRDFVFPNPQLHIEKKIIMLN